MVISSYRPRIDGPEYALERLLMGSIEGLLGGRPSGWWCAASFPVGASRPDILMATYEPHVRHLSQSAPLHINVISYLYGVRRARPETISARIRKPIIGVKQALDRLVDLGIAKKASTSFYLNPTWRRVLPRVVSIEVKVKNWQRAIQQAKINLAFSHEAYVAVPKSIAYRIVQDQDFTSTAIGLISLDGDTSSILRTPVPSLPSVPSYYFKIAAAVARTN